MPPSKEGGIFYDGYIFFDHPNFIFNMHEFDYFNLEQILIGQ